MSFAEVIYADKPKRCLRCKWFFLCGSNGGSCLRRNKDK